jgi:hypothetical protein
MTPQEKAKQLVGNFCNVEFLKDYEGMDYELAKECALIAVDEILSSRPYITESQLDYQYYWEQVKIEIKKL